MSVKSSTIAALIAAGLTATSDAKDIKTKYFSVTNTPLTKANFQTVVDALGGSTEGVTDDSAAAAAPAAAKEAKAPKAKKEKAAAAPKEPKAPKVQETPSAALARLKADPTTSAKWARVQEVLEMGKKGPVRVRIVCDDKGANGEELTRDIKIQDLFQVKYSVGYKKPRAAKAAAPAAEASASAAS